MLTTLALLANHSLALVLEDGGIIVGQYLQPGVVIKSRPVFEAIYERIRKNLECGADVTITTEDYRFKY